MSGLHAVILAAGKGERLAPLTDETNKVLLDIGGRPLIAYLLDGLAQVGICRVTIITGHCASLVERAVLQNQPDLNVSFVNNPDFTSTNNIVSVAVGLADIPRGTSILLIEGDLILEPALLESMIKGDLPDLALVDRFRPGLDGTLAIVQDDVITGLIMGEQLAGLSNRNDYYKTVNVTRLSSDALDQHFRPALTDWLALGRHDDYYEAVLGFLIANDRIKLGAVDVRGARWAEIDDAIDLERARSMFALNGSRTVLNRAFGGHWNHPMLDFAYPHNCRFPTPAVHQELAARLPSILSQYGSAQSILDEKLSRYTGRPPDELILLNGVSQIFPWLAEKYGTETALIPRPCFGEYQRVWPNAITYPDDGDIDVARIVAAAAPCGVVVIVNPNNPTGSMVNSADILAMAAAHPSKTFVVDESFADFSVMPDLWKSCNGILPPNIVILKSLGKSLGVSGLRIGFFQCSAHKVCEEVRAWLPIWNSNSLAEVFLELLPKHRTAINNSWAKTRADRADMQGRLAALPLVAEVRPSEANFLSVRLNIPEVALDELLDRLFENWGIYIKDISGRVVRPGAWVRIAVRTRADNDRLYAALGAESVLPAAISPAIQ